MNGTHLELHQSHRSCSIIVPLKVGEQTLERISKAETDSGKAG